MHNFILGFFKFLKSAMQFMKIIIMICIMLLVLYWIQNLVGAKWDWLGFIVPFLDGLLDFANSIYSFSFDLWGSTFELKYLSAIIILALTAFGMKLLQFGVDIIEGIYLSARFVAKKTEENLFNKALKQSITNEQKKLNKYTIVINTKPKTTYGLEQLNINLEEQNKIMNDFITEKLGIKPMFYNGGFMYKFENFDRVDNILDVLFKIINSSAPLQYAICVQIGDEIRQLNKLIELQHYGKITMAADTSYRYRFNETHRYQTSQLGIFQYGNDTIEVHEFTKISIV